jgi:uncharacterized damage-inducible protein DinB
MKYGLLSCLFLPFCAFAQATMVQEYQSRWENATAYTLEVAEAMPAEDYGYQPTEDQMSFGAQLLHLTGNMVWIGNSFLGYDESDFDVKAFRETLRSADATDKDRVIALARRGLTFVKNALAQLDPASLDEVQNFFAGPHTRRHLLILLNDHHTHHRAQAIVYLRLRGVEPPRYRGW